jgi:hypothetical protein
MTERPWKIAESCRFGAHEADRLSRGRTGDSVPRGIESNMRAGERDGRVSAREIESEAGLIRSVVGWLV